MTTKDSDSPNTGMRNDASLKQARSSLNTFFFHGIFLVSLFAAVFYGIDYVTRLRDAHFALYFEWETTLPQLPQAYAVYYSVLAVPFLIPVYLTEAASILNWTKRMSVAIVLAGLVFLLLPAKLGYPPKGSDSWTWFEQLTSYVAGTHNLVPSLHVALSVITFAAIWERLGKGAKRIIILWAIALMSSTILTHQHHTLDVIAGLLLGFGVSTPIRWR